MTKSSNPRSCLTFSSVEEIAGREIYGKRFFSPPTASESLFENKYDAVEKKNIRKRAKPDQGRVVSGSAIYLSVTSGHLIRLGIRKDDESRLRPNCEL